MGHAVKIQAQEEMAQIKAELAAAREREKEFRKEQLFLLQQMQGLKEALIRPQPLEHGLRPIITDR
jgi:hypothetical protein